MKKIHLVIIALIVIGMGYVIGTGCFTTGCKAKKFFSKMERYVYQRNIFDTVALFDKGFRDDGINIDHDTFLVLAKQLFTTYREIKLDIKVEGFSEEKGKVTAHIAFSILATDQGGTRGYVVGSRETPARAKVLLGRTGKGLAILSSKTAINRENIPL